MSYVWWHSGYDMRCHAFAADQAKDGARGFYQAVCEHSVPLERVEHGQHGQHGQLCVTCLIKVGTELPEDVRWTT